ncbi:DUF2179 domain-containing protein [Mariniphaga sediminis]|jgi:uncharacterized protein YebE (UPF0316 family)|uniref:UPF0316 protein D1164_19060 n=1 Tax=Mariniphaga sediminis TaxID=1628158 RepID=A0A399CYR1_9BACT|nr:DUF2179 domain-containing protein [Mariniphaga sediminis]RIH63531.1 DUF2179 domain-containing protein [Mariniphaga sediminis]
MVILETFYDSTFFTYLLLPFLIFVSRIMDVTIGTIRIVMVSKGQKLWAPILGFFEILIWLLAISKIFENLDNWVNYIAYAAGFATGNYIGLIIEERLAMGIVKIQIITRKSAEELIVNLKNAGYGITHHEARGSSETVSIIYSIIKRTEINKVQNIVKSTNPKAFYSIEDVKQVSHGIFPVRTVTRRMRKSK